jgi:hypothetical protein
MKTRQVVLLAVAGFLSILSTNYSCASESTVSANVTFSYAINNMVFFIAEVENNTGIDIYLLSPMDYVTWPEVNTCSFTFSSALSREFAGIFSEHCPILILLKPGDKWAEVFDISLALECLNNPKMPQCYEGTICITIGYLTDSMSLDYPVEDVLSRIYHEQVVIHSQPYPYAM